MRGIVREGTRSFSYQRAIPVRFRKHFDGKKKFIVSLDTRDEEEASRRAAVVKRDFDARCGVASDGDPPINIAAIAGLIFDAVLHRDEMVELEEAVSGEIAVLEDDGHPLVHGLPLGGPTYSNLNALLKQMCEDAERRTRSSQGRTTRVGRTLNEQAVAWRKLPSPLSNKTRDQYVKDVDHFSSWYLDACKRAAVGTVITKKQVNSYVESRMRVDEAKNTIFRRLSGLKKIYKSGMFSDDDNPFANVAARIDITGPVLEIRAFTDQEVRAIFKEAKEWDLNVQWAVRIAAYTGFRLSEICRLRVEDLKSIQIGSDTICYLDYAKGRAAKNRNSYRQVPVHPSLISDLRAFLAGRDGFILEESDANKYGSRSAAISQRANRLIDLVNDDRDVREHSFRHTVITKLADEGVREEVRKALTGHKGSDPHDGYNHAKRIRELSDAINRIAY